MTEPANSNPPESPASSLFDSLSVEALKSIIEGLLEAYRMGSDREGASEDLLAAVGDAEELVDSMRRARGEEVAVVTRPLMPRFLSRARRATTIEEVEVLLAYARSLAIRDQAILYEAALMRNAAILSTDRIVQWLGREPLENNVSVAVVELSRNPHLTLPQAETVLHGLREKPEHYPLYMSWFLRLYPGLLTSEHMKELASDLEHSDQPNFQRYGVMSSIAGVVVDYVLPRGALAPESMTLTVRFLSEYDTERWETLMQHPSVGPKVWLEMIARNQAQIVLVLLKTPRALANKQVQKALVAYADKRSPGVSPDMADLIRVFPLDAIGEPLDRLIKFNSEYCLKVIGKLPPERRATAQVGAMLGEIAATHPKADTRLAAILLSGTVLPESTDFPAEAKATESSRRL